MSVRQSGEWMGLDGFVWFFGVVEDRMDPLKVGRVRVRCYGWHTDDKGKVPTSSLPWSQVMLPINSASLSSIGVSATGLIEGSTVIGFFLDGKNAQLPMILGSIAGIPHDLINRDKNAGFNDPFGIYPLDDEIGNPDTPRLAYDRFTEDYVTTAKTATRVTDIPTASIYQLDTVAHPKDYTAVTWSEPEYRAGAASVYPFNHVHQTESGHAFEIDDTIDELGGGGRIHEWHRTGTYREIQSSGDRVTKVIGNSYEIIVNNNNVLIKGDCNITVNGNARLFVGGDLIEEVAGDHHQTIHGSRYTKIDGSDHTEIASSRVANISQDDTLKVDGDSLTNVGQNYTLSVSVNLTQSAGNDSSFSTMGNAVTMTIGTYKNVGVDTMNFTALSNLKMATGTTFDMSAGGYAKYQYNGEYAIRYEGDKHEHIGADTYSRHDGGVDYSKPGDPVRTSGTSSDDVPVAGEA